MWVIEEGVNVFYCMFGKNGGEPYIIIDKYTGEVINVTHTH
ncbi:MAG TPA: hypothetical protein DCQ43_08070 [Treponema sp.]|nr:hypothetical protein [Treponema sp.]